MFDRNSFAYRGFHSFSSVLLLLATLATSLPVLAAVAAEKSPAASAASETVTPVGVIFDTDIYSDIDDMQERHGRLFLQMLELHAHGGRRAIGRFRGLSRTPVL